MCRRLIAVSLTPFMRHKNLSTWNLPNAAQYQETTKDNVKPRPDIPFDKHYLMPAWILISVLNYN